MRFARENSHGYLLELQMYTYSRSGEHQGPLNLCDEFWTRPVIEGKEIISRLTGTRSLSSPSWASSSSHTVITAAVSSSSILIYSALIMWQDLGHKLCETQWGIYCYCPLLIDEEKMWRHIHKIPSATHLLMGELSFSFQLPNCGSSILLLHSTFHIAYSEWHAGEWVDLSLATACQCLFLKICVLVHHFLI